MDFQQITQQLLQAATARDDVGEWQPDTPLLGHIAELDSMAIVTFFTALEDEHGVFVDDDEVSAELFETLETLTGFVAEKLEG
ncbi:acyl carrier protein [Motiliproteus sp.]|uniref:acyl carrier protein n=1 Tax=Motiliproteus sp. TaxID=1898955 RepID=UPI003BA97210